jgi:midasin (ATPase involved in ribosome maturation)
MLAAGRLSYHLLASPCREAEKSFITKSSASSSTGKCRKEFPKSSHVRLGTFFIDASKTREEILITRRHFPGISRDFTHI